MRLLSLLVCFCSIQILAKDDELELHFLRAKARTALLLRVMQPRYFGRETPPGDIRRLTDTFNANKTRMVQFAENVSLTLRAMAEPNNHCARVSNWERNEIEIFERSCRVGSPDAAVSEFIRAIFAHLLNSNELGLAAVIAFRDGARENHAFLRAVGTFALNVEGRLPNDRQPSSIILTVRDSDGTLQFEAPALKNLSNRPLAFESSRPTDSGRYVLNATQATVSSQGYSVQTGGFDLTITHNY